MKLKYYLDGAAGLGFFTPNRGFQLDLTRAKTLMEAAEVSQRREQDEAFLQELDQQARNHRAYCVGNLVMHVLLCLGALGSVYLATKVSVPLGWAAVPALAAVAIRLAAEIRYRRRRTRTQGEVIRASFRGSFLWVSAYRGELRPAQQQVPRA